MDHGLFGPARYFRCVKCWILLLLGLAPLHLLAQGTPKTLLWRVQGTDPSRPSYLYGTVHSMDGRAFRFTDSMTVALERVDLVAGELDMDLAGEQAAGLLHMVIMPDGKRLEDLYRKKDWRVVESALKKELGFQAVLAERMKPYFVIALLTGPGESMDHEEMLDDAIMRMARDNGQRVIGLETVEEQIAALDVLPLKQQAAMLLEHVEGDGGEEEMNELLDAYAEQDLDRLMAIASEEEGMPPELERSLLMERNVRMAQRMDSIMQGGETGFFAIGAAHLPKPTGLIALLQNKGYSVEPVFSAYRKEEPTPKGDDDK